MNGSSLFVCEGYVSNHLPPLPVYQVGVALLNTPKHTLGNGLATIQSAQKYYSENGIRTIDTYYAITIKNRQPCYSCVTVVCTF